jgi:hypothetical protein
MHESSNLKRSADESPDIERASRKARFAQPQEVEGTDSSVDLCNLQDVYDDSTNNSIVLTPLVSFLKIVPDSVLGHRCGDGDSTRNINTGWNPSSDG